MVKIIKNHTRKFVLSLIIIILIPLGVRIVSECDFFLRGSSEWIGFFGSYIGTIIGSLVTICVLMTTLNDSKDARDKKEVIEFCNYMVEKSAILARKYEETIYAANTYLAYCSVKKEFSDKELDLYMEFVSVHHLAKAIMYEIDKHLNIRKDIEIFKTTSMPKVLQLSNNAYNAISDYEIGVQVASKSEKITDMLLMNEVEDLLNVLEQYEKELLDKQR